ncbi:DUF3397 domain-containing protein [Halobacillus litoralis]|uniref:DUF3397 domain-containing protein n=1 Tax=Halobacillus litoralis TaxID=45668 RepID=UPI001CD287E0|nr:DUF3397 domain-containing protein [Halobacillus litoralis]MCA0969378.1 DUF3397 domain-containing protein [Halobacillus litoralis]
MGDLIIYVFAAIVTMPIPFLFVLYFLSRKWHGHKRKAVHQTANLSAPVFMIAVHVLLLVLFNQSFLAYIVIGLILLLGLSLIIQYKLHEELQFRRAFKGFWRASFLLFMFMYMGLSLFGVIGSLMA